MTFALHDTLGVSWERGNELSAELHSLLHAPGSNMNTVAAKLAETHDPESVLIGAFLGLAVLMNDQRVVPQGYRVGVDMQPIPEPKGDTG